MKEINKTKDLPFLKYVFLVFKEHCFHAADRKDPNWVDKTNNIVVEAYNLEQKLIDLIELTTNKEIEGLTMPEVKTKKK